MPEPDITLKRALLNEAVKYQFFNAADGDKTFNSNGTFTRTTMFYNNLTINSGVTVSPWSGNSNSTRNQCVFVKGTLTFADSTSIINANGNTSSSGYGGSGVAGSGAAGSGRQGGGSVLILANAISGLGTVRASGDNGTNAAAASSVNNGTLGTTGLGRDTAIITAQTASASAGGGGTAQVTSKKPSCWLPNYLAITALAVTFGGGGSSGADNNGGSQGGGGGAGGMGIGGDGGNGGAGNAGASGSGGGGGGGGGLVYLFCLGSVPALTLQATGGNAGNGNSNGGGGGGGGGGLIMVVSAGTDSSTKSVTAGTFGTGANSGVAGTDGVSLSFAFQSYESLLGLKQ